MTGFRYIAALIALVLALPAGVAAQNREHLQLTADLRVLQEQLAKVQLATNQLLELYKATNKRLDDMGSANQKASADIQLLINNLGTTVTTLREKLDDNTVRVQQLAQELPSI